MGAEYKDITLLVLYGGCFGMPNVIHHTTCALWRLFWHAKCKDIIPLVLYGGCFAIANIKTYSGYKET